MGKRLLALPILVLLAMGAGAAAENPIKNLKARYSKIRSVHLVATGQMWIRGEGRAASGDLRLEYWADGDKYRIRSHANPVLGLAPDLEVAFDHLAWQLFDPSSSTLHISRNDPSSDTRDVARSESIPLPIALPNPLFLPLEFISPNGQGCQGCRLRLADLSNDSVWSQSELISPTGHIEGRMQGTGHHAYETKFETVARTIVPTSIIKTENGVKSVEIDAALFITPDSLVGPLPTKVKGYGPDGISQVMSMTFSIDVLQINQDLPESAFRIETKGIDKVWDIDAKTFVKHPDSVMLNRRFE